MEPALKSDFLTVEEYLDGEEHSELRHEYSAGVVFAMAGGTDNHNLIVGSLYSGLRAHLRGGPCRVFMENVRLYLDLSQGDLFYYPDIMVTCDPRDTNPQFIQFPKVVVEVLSEGTERIDRSEKFWNYVKLESLEEYVIIDQHKMDVILFRRSANWQPEMLRAASDHLKLISLKFSMSLADLYEDVRF